MIRSRAEIHQTSHGSATPSSEEIEFRICLDQPVGDDNVAVEFFELYILSECDLLRAVAVNANFN